MSRRLFCLPSFKYATFEHYIAICAVQYKHNEAQIFETTFVQGKKSFQVMGTTVRYWNGKGTGCVRGTWSGIH